MRTRPVYLCERCNGIGGWKEYEAKDDIEFYFECPDCNGTGMNYSKKYKHETKRQRAIDRNDTGSAITNDDGSNGSS